MTFSLACDFATKLRVKHRDFRRMLFAKPVDLLAVLSPTWAKREAPCQEDTIIRHPFDDATG